MSSKNFYGLTGDVTVDGGILNVGNAQLYANTETSNVGVGTPNPEFQLDVHGDANVGVLYSTFLHGDGSNIQNIVSSQWEGSPGDPIYYASNVGIANTSPVTSTMQIGSNVVIDDVGSNVIHVTGNIYADYLVGDGSQLTGIAASLDQIVDQGNTVSNTIQIVSGQDATSNVGLVTHEGVGISVSNANPTGEYQFGVGSNLLVNVYSSNVLIVDGNVFAQKMTLGTVTVTPAYNLQQIMATGATSDQTLILSNATTGLTTTSNVGIANTAPVHTLDVGSNLYVEDTGSNVLTVTGNVSVSNLQVTERLDVGSNVHIENLRVAEVAANLVTYDSSTGELMDSGGLFSNKLAVVSEQPPVALTGASTVVAKHGTYTIEASSTATGSEVYHLFDKNPSTVWRTDDDPLKYKDDGSYDGSASLAGYDGEWVKITIPYKTILRHVKIESTNSSIKDVTIVGLNADGLTWTDLKTENDLNEETSTIIVNATTHHRTYGLIVRATNIGSSQAEIGDLKLFTESFSIDGGKVEMASSAVMGGETTMDQHGPHGRGEAKLKKFPEIIFEEGKFDRNDTTSPEYFIQAGYKVTASGSFQDIYYPWRVFDGLHNHSTGQTGWYSRNVGGNYNPSYNGSPVINLGTASGGTATVNGEYLTLEIPNKICLKRYTLYGPNQEVEFPADWTLYGSNDGTSWESIDSQTGQVIGSGTSNTNGSASGQSKSYSIVNTTQYDRYAIVVTKINSSGYYYFGLQGLEIYGYEEDPPAGDTSIDTTFSSIMNTPQTTGAKVYVDGPTLENKITTGPDATGPSATYDSTGKYWELNGTLTSNIAVEANTFLEGDQPHSVSVWFNSSNLEANVSNTCVFSISDQEKLDSVNLDLQSNTWHNLTYAYQGEGGSRVTYLDGRKVAEDQAEDTFGDYPPFAMTGYSQGGYVVSASSDVEASADWRAWKLFNDTEGNEGWHTSSTFTSGGNATHDGTQSLGGNPGEWLKLEMPHKLHLSYIYLLPRDYTDNQEPVNFKIIGSNDDENWAELINVVGASWTQGVAQTFTVSGQPQSFKYLAIVVSRTTGSGACLLSELKFYGHRENDLVRLPDPTNVLKYPHIAMTGPAQRGYVASASSLYLAGGEAVYPAWEAFDYNTGIANRWASENAQNYNGGSFLYSGNKNLGTNNGGSGTPDGEWLMIEMPHKIKLQSTKIFANGNALEVPDKFIIYGSNNLTGVWSVVDNTYETTSAAIPFGGTGKTWTVSTSASPVAYKYFGLVVRNTTGSTFLTTVNEWELYGTGVDSVPIQIGGGNIDKVANFRVYDKFVGEDQALEIWDAQKDEFGRAKSSMTLQKGRLGIGTTEPEGRLAVLDEPNGLEEFPPRAMTAEETYMEGHGVFRAFDSVGTSQSNAFNKNPNDIVYIPGQVYDETSPYSANALAPSTMGVYGSWIQLNCPYGVNVSKVLLSPRNGYENSVSMASGYLFASNDETIWDEIYHFTNIIQPTQGDYVTFNTTSNRNYYKYLRLVCTNLQGLKAGDMNWQHAEIRYFGTREQGQSVLHDGQLTLTKSLNVPRIGPALDADDTPRRDRLVVEYNTSTNPTFEGAVRDTSGRGLDGCLKGGAYYDATEKALEFDGVDDYIQTGLSINAVGTPQHTFSLWVKPSAGDMDDTANHYICVWGNTTAQNSWSGLALKSGRLAHVYHSSGKYTSDVLFTTNKWHHIVVVIKSTTATTAIGRDVDFYVDGVLYSGSYYTLGSNPGNSAYYLDWGSGTSTRVRLGSLLNGSEDSSSSISNFKLYDVALTAEEVKTLYDMGRLSNVIHKPLQIKADVKVTGSLQIPTDRGDAGTLGMLMFNTEIGKLQVHNGVAWVTLGGISATGGTVTYADGYTIHTFTSSGTFTVYSGGDVEYLVVAGGGGAPGRDVGGGGGAGGMLTGTLTGVGSGPYTINVGAGGSGKGDSAEDVSGMKGGNSTFGSTITATGGGAGKPYNKALPSGDDNGGSGGGGAGLFELTAGTGISGQGFNGGEGGANGTTYYGGGGGGGAGQVGSSALNGRHGGNGIQSSITGTTTYYAGGGGGAGHRSQGNGTEGDGGLGGGGPCNQSTTTSTRNGTDGLGGGGGASRNTDLTGGNGGSGIVILRYLT